MYYVVVCAERFVSVCCCVVCSRLIRLSCFFFQAEDGIRDLVRSRGLGDVYKRQARGLEGSMVVTTPQTGEVVAMVGGRRASFDGFNLSLIHI